MWKFNRDVDLVGFFQVVNTCKGDVFYDTSEGDHLNFSSALSRFVFTAIVPAVEYLESGSIRCTCMGDYEALAQYIHEV